MYEPFLHHSFARWIDGMTHANQYYQSYMEKICEEEVEHRIIDGVATNYWKKFETYVAGQIANYGDTNKYSHSEKNSSILSLEYIEVRTSIVIFRSA